MGEKERTEPSYNHPEKDLHLQVFYAVSKFKSVRRAIRRGKVAEWGEIIPSRPFNNSKRTEGRKLQKEKEVIYGNIRHKLQLRNKGITE